MSWFFFTLIGPFLYALTNHIDKILLEKYFRSGGVGTLMLVSSLLSVIPLPIIVALDPSVLDVGLLSGIGLATVGFCNVLLLWFYFLALKNDEASIVIVFYQLVPVFGYIMGYFLLGEVLTQAQLVAMSIIILGTTIISFEVDTENNFRLRKKTVLYMLAASFFWSLGSVIFKAVALQESVLRSLFWEHGALVMIGVILFFLVKSYRVHFLRALRDNSKQILLLNFGNETLYIVGSVIFSFAYLLAPISLVLLANSFQPIFVLAIGIFLTIFFPRISVEKIHAYHVWQKILAACITCIGTYLLLVSS